MSTAASNWFLGDLAQQFGWPLVTLRRRLAAWVEAGHIAQFSGGQGQGHPGSHAVVAGSRNPTDRTRLQHRGRRPCAPAPKTARSAMAVITAGVLFLTALGLDGGRPGDQRGLRRAALARLRKRPPLRAQSALRSICSRSCCRRWASSFGTPAVDPGRRFGLDDLARRARDDAARRHGLRLHQHRRCGRGPRQDRERQRTVDRAHRPASARTRRHLRNAPGRRDRRSSCRRRTPEAQWVWQSHRRLPRRDASNLSAGLRDGARTAAGTRRRRAARHGRRGAARRPNETARRCRRSPWPIRRRRPHRRRWSGSVLVRSTRRRTISRGCARSALR